MTALRRRLELLLCSTLSELTRCFDQSDMDGSVRHPERMQNVEQSPWVSAAQSELSIRCNCCRSKFAGSFPALTEAVRDVAIRIAQDPGCRTPISIVVLG
jgi:hypothetical protein